jgi:hypothetical protein
MPDPASGSFLWDSGSDNRTQAVDINDEGAFLGHPLFFTAPYRIHFFSWVV